MEVYTVEVEESKPAIGDKPSAGPTYRCIYAKDGLMELPEGIQSPWEFFRYDQYMHLDVPHVAIGLTQHSFLVSRL